MMLFVEIRLMLGRIPTGRVNLSKEKGLHDKSVIEGLLTRKSEMVLFSVI